MKFEISTKPTWPLWIVAVFLLTGWSLSVPAAKAQETLKWYSYEEGLLLGEKRGKKLLVKFRADWCTACKKMERETLKESTVVSRITQRFIPVEVDFDREKDLARKFHVTHLPIFLILTPQGELAGKIFGFMPAKFFLNHLEGFDEK